MATWTKEKRDKLPKGHFGDPEKEAFPIEDQEDVEHAAELLHHSDNPEKVKRNIERIVKELGLKLPKTWEKSESGKSVSLEGETFVCYGGEAKSISDDMVGGYLVKFSDPSTTDLEGDFFTKETDFGLDDDTGVSRVLYDHGLDGAFKKAKIGTATIGVDDVGVWIKAQIDLRKAYGELVAKKYGKALKDLIAAKALGWSSGTVGHLIEKQRMGGANWIKSWPLGLDASLTPVPADPRTLVTSIKSLAASRLKRPDPFEAESEGPDYQAAQTAHAALSHLHEVHRMHVYGVLHDHETPLKDRVKSLSGHYDNYRDRSMKAIGSLMSYKSIEADAIFQAQFTDAYTKSLADLKADSHSEAVLAAVKGLRDRFADILEKREADKPGRSLSMNRRAQLKAVIGDLSSLLERAETAAKKAPVSGDPAQEARLRAAKASLLQHRIDDLAQILG